jgi:predicted PolB exonuclease-like 3'-5' exonuclease
MPAVRRYQPSFERAKARRVDSHAEANGRFMVSNAECKAMCQAPGVLGMGCDTKKVYAVVGEGVIGCIG